jgi:glutamate N-acetyltransferase/amino-acid N-acetyltransferase
MNNTIICPGFKAAAVASGIKKNGNLDLGLIYSETDAAVAGIFTKNRVKAAPVLLDIQRIKSGTCRAFIANSGNANCCTGDKGLKDAIEMAQLAASGLNISENLVLVASTGVIGQPLPVDKVKNAVPQIIGCLSENGLNDFARSIMTTDTIPKLVSRHGSIDGNTFTVTGIAKGAGMIRPDMATMLCFVITDIGASSDILREAILLSAQLSFNKITIDGDTSTNDTVLIMANGVSGAFIKNDAHKQMFQRILDDLFLTLARMVVKDGEGVTKVVEIIVKHAANHNDAKQVADTVAESNLVKTAFFGEDANWGRIIGAVGRANVSINPDVIDIYFNDVLMVKNSIGCGNDAEVEATKILKKPEFSVTVDLNMGHGSASVLTCDFSVDYVKINADYRT